MNPLLAIQIALGASAAVALLYLWRSGFPEPSERLRHAVVFAGVVVAIISIWTAPLVALLVSGVTAPAKIVSLECPAQGRRYVHFEYAVDGHALSGVARDEISPLVCGSLAIGRLDVVTYLPDSPDVYAWRSPWPSLRFNLLCSAIALVAYPVMALVARQRY